MHPVDRSGQQIGPGDSGLAQSLFEIGSLLLWRRRTLHVAVGADDISLA